MQRFDIDGVYCSTGDSPLVKYRTNEFLSLQLAVNYAGANEIQQTNVRSFCLNKHQMSIICLTAVIHMSLRRFKDKLGGLIDVDSTISRILHH